MSGALDCENQPTSPRRLVIDLAVCILVACSLIPQIICFATADSSDAGVSPWYIIFMALSVNGHLAARTGGTFTKASYDCIRNGHLPSWKGLSAVVMWIQILVHWAACIALVAVYVSFRHRHIKDKIPLGYAVAQSPAQLVHTTTTGPSNAAIVAIMATHALIVLPPAVYILLNKLPVYGSMTFGLFQQFLYIVLAITGLATSVAAPIFQVQLMVARSHEGLGLGSLSVLGTGLQAIAYLAVCLSQSVRLWFWSTDQTPGISAVMAFVIWFVDVSGPAVSYGVMAVGQLVVLCVALGLERRGGSLRL
ncbi:hypothetical protein BJY04DRAFT_216206 [Aspergillus karnatakaensis]|uniref:uncharacterized protein n=1 Tax=Aspergillus karnatakaensis TaxID=1810916 RepID=UPI003CCE2628